MEAAEYCALITLDRSGRPQARTMDPFAPDDAMTVWLGTHRASRKVAQIRNDPRVALYYEAPGGAGYVAISGTAHLVDDPSEKARRWKEEWEQFYVDRESDYLLIEVTPEVLEIVDYSRDIVGDPDTWRVPSVQLVPRRAWR
jgi:general stress protein 26